MGVVALYDVVGRLMGYGRFSDGTVMMRVASDGVYLLKVNGRVVQKIVITG